MKVCTYELCGVIKNSFEINDSFVITNVPRRRKAIIEYGIDHSELLARSVAKSLGVEYVRLLKSNAKSEQKSLTKEQRLKNTDFKLTSDVSLKGKYVIIIDDVITTGASVGSAATMIRSLHPGGIYAAALGIAYKDDM